MVRIAEVAEKYGASVGFVVQALGKLGVEVAPDASISDGDLARFETTYGDSIRAATGKGPAPAAEPARGRREPPPHVIRVAHEKFGGYKDRIAMTFQRKMLDDPGIAHAIDAAGTRDGDPWRGEAAPGVHTFYDGKGPHAACGVQVTVLMGDLFDLERQDACPKCAEVVTEGKAFRDPPWDRPERRYFCTSFINHVVDGRREIEDCKLRDGHEGRHESREGTTWNPDVIYGV